ncbi:MAG: dihydrolipoyl dehydrogenase [Gammaproteobacteria bacterium]|nr:dihydrolipoyl dehydrogenase [Gammaproteobacteria bacterium]NNF60234.1 dihydrolipoyl dehydrogenase [Gammaproteobacteria bacterium]NNM20342.1 dihydrolipoyl dehydrogenase [Gammaproteobacteria bacterium]
MSAGISIRVPDIGDFTNVDVIEVHVSAGDTVAAEDPLITLETDKAAMDIPAPQSGTVGEVSLAVGDKASEGTLVCLLQPSETATDTPAAAMQDVAQDVTQEAAPVAGGYTGKVDLTTQLVALGAGVGGYAAAFRAADSGLQVTLVDRWPTLGGVCLNVGCIPSKAYLHAAKVIEDAAHMAGQGITFGPPEIDHEKLRGWKDQVVKKLTGGLAGLAKQRKVDVIQGEARFLSPHHLEITGPDGTRVLQFEQCVIAAGSEPARLPFQPDDERILDSTSALELEGLPESMLVIGGGIIGLEMATVYSALGTKITVVELTDKLIPECDQDLVRPLRKRIAKQYQDIYLGTSVTGMKAGKKGITVTFEGKDAPAEATYDRVLVAIGRKPNGALLDAENAGVVVDDRGFISVDRQMRTNVSHIFAVGDIVGQPMLAHKGTHQGRVAAEVAAGHKVAFDARVIPSVAYTDPEIAWVGITENEAKAAGIDYGKGVFPWAASGRSLGMGRDEGSTKLLFDEDTGQIIGAGIVGPHAGDLISECALAIEMGCDAEDLGLTIHPHPTLSETVMMAAEMFEGTIIDLYAPKKKKKKK